MQHDDNPEHDDHDDLDPPGEDDNRGPLHGLLMGPPVALASDCGLVKRNDEKKIPGCCACLSCDQCGQLFRIDLLSSAGNHACPKCKLEYTSLLVVATADDHTMLQYALETVLAANGVRVPNAGDPEDLDDDPDGDPVDDDEPGGEDLDGDDLPDDPDQVDDPGQPDPAR